MTFLERAARGEQGGATYLFCPAMPTPNGGLHLGHMAGPFLKMDALARYRRMLGDRATLISGADVFESYVRLKALETNQRPEEVANRYHRMISKDLAALDIEMDAFINVNEPRWRSAYHERAGHLIRNLDFSGRVSEGLELMPYSGRDRRWVTGCWLLGACPECGAESGGYSCEECGAWSSPEQLLGPRDRLDSALEWREVKSLHLRLDGDALLGQLTQMHVAPDQRGVVERYLRREGPRLRLTEPGSWGVRWEDYGNAWSYSVGQAAYFSLFGDLHADLTGSSVNAFAPDSGVITVVSGGTDNVLTYLLANVGIAQATSVRSFDHVLVNRFCHLEDSKFSTSRGHAIWAHDMVEGARVPGDLVRYYLASISPDEDMTTFSIEGFLRTANGEIVERLDEAAARCWAAFAGQPVRPSEACVARLNTALESQARAYDLGSVRLQQAAATVRDWAAESELAQQEPYWWLVGASLLAYPLVPRWAQTYWSALGRAGRPGFDNLMSDVSARPTAPPDRLAPLTYEQIVPALPATLAPSERPS